MKTHKIFIFFMFPVFIFTGSLLYSQGFNSVSVSQGTNVTAAGDSGKIFRSFDSGISWSSPSAPSVNFNSISSSGQYIYLTASNNKIYRIYSSFNSSVSEFTISGNYIFNSVYFVNDSAGFICGDNGAVFRTTDEGITWNLQNSDISDLKLNSVSFKDLYNGVIAADNGFIFLTTNSGNSWQSAVTIPLTNNNLLKVKYFTDGIAVAGKYGTLLIKRNNSPDWVLVNTRVKSDIRGITGSGINDIHICGGGGYVRNNKFNNTEFTNFEPNPMMANLTDISMFDSMTGYAVSSHNKAIIKTTNGGISWNFTQGVYAAYTWDRKATAFQTYGNTLCKHPYNNKTFFCGMGNRVYVSRNDGETWSDIAGVPGTSMHSFYISPLDTNIWMCAIKGTPSKIMRTTNYGNNWTTSIAATFSAFGQPLEMDQNDPSVYYFAPDGGGFYRSADNGISFQLISNYPFQSPCDILVMWDSSEVMFVGDGPTNGSGGKIYRSSNGGYNWSLVFSNSSAIEIPSMSNSVFEKNIIYSTETGPNFWKSTDYGNTFFSFLQTLFITGHLRYARKTRH